MHQFAKSKMVGTINGLSHNEYKLLGRWLKSPFFNSSKPLIRFYEVIKKYHPEYDHPKCSKEKLFKKIYPGDPYRAKAILTLMSDLTKHVEEFLVYQQLKKDPELREQLIKNSYLQRNQVERYEKRAYSRIKKLEAKDLLKRKELLELEQLYEELYFRANTNVRNNPKQQALKKANYNLDRYYALGKHRLLNEIIERKKTIKGDSGFKINKEILQKLREDLKEPVLDLYASKFEIALLEEEKGYDKIRNQFLNSFHSFELQDQKILFITLLNMAVRLKARTGREAKLNEIYNLQQLGLKHGWFLHNDQMTITTYYNILYSQSYLGKIALSKKFVEKYTPKLDPTIQEEAKAWGYANINFYNGNFRKTIDILNNLNTTSHVFNFQRRVLLLMAYFDLNQEDDSYSEFFNYYSLATEKFLRRDKFITKSKMDSILKLMRYANKLAMNLQDKKIDIKFLSKLEEEIKEERNLSAKEWLLEKIQEIKVKAVT